MKQLFYFFFVLAIALQSCSEGDGSSKKYVPPSSGTHAELLLVTKDSLLRSRVGEALQNTFGREQYGLPQSEGVFSINTVDASGFQGLLKKAKSIVFVEIGDTTMIQTQYDVWAQPQIITTIIAPSKKQLAQLIQANDDKLVSIYHESDLGVVRGRMKGNVYKKLPESLNDLGIKSMYLQLGFEQTLDKADIKIFRQQTKKTEQFLIFTSRPIVDTLLPGQEIIAERDSIGKKYFEGHAANSYFATEQIVPPQQTTTTLDGRFAIETRGLWKTVGDFMGGPFLSYTVYDDEQGKVITIEGFIYGPDAKKRNVLLEMEGMITSVKFD